MDRFKNVGYLLKDVTRRYAASSVTPGKCP